LIGINLSGDPGCYHCVAHGTWDHAPKRARHDGTTDAPAYFRCVAIVAIRLRPLKTHPSSFPVRPRSAGLLLLRNCCLNYLPGLAVNEVEAEGFGSLPEASESSRPLLSVVGIGAFVAIDQVAF
jgi:hypothetical protein